MALTPPRLIVASNASRLNGSTPALASAPNITALMTLPLFSAIAAKRGGETRYAACMVSATTRADVNGLVRRHLDARKASFAPVDAVTAATAMEYGGITPVGLPEDWPVLVDETVAKTGSVIIGSGIRGSKLRLPGPLLAALPAAQVLPGLGIPVTPAPE